MTARLGVSAADSAGADVPIEPGLTLGRYAVHGTIAAGGMATVHFARLVGPVGFGRTVAIKRLHRHLASDPPFVAMFLDEARLASRVRHPNVVQTLDVVAESGELFVVMDYVHGEALSRLLRGPAADLGRPSAGIAAAIATQVLHGLHAAHELRNGRNESLGLVHGDVSPQNIMVGADGTARVLDFGIARVGGQAPNADDERIVGKLAYMSPEQLRGERTDRRTDVYSLSVVLWEMLTGRRLFDGDSVHELSTRLSGTAVPAPSSVDGGVSSGLDAIVLRGLAPSATERWASAREMALALERLGILASPSDVGAWVERGAASQLAERAATLARIDASLLADEARNPSEEVSHLILKTPARAVPAVPPSSPLEVDLFSNDFPPSKAPPAALAPPTAIASESVLVVRATPSSRPRVPMSLLAIAVVAALCGGIVGAIVATLASRGAMVPSVEAHSPVAPRSSAGP